LIASRQRVFVVCDLVEERWPSMDFTAEAIVNSLDTHGDGSLVPVRVCPPMVRRFSRVEARESSGYAADRALNRFWDYPRLIRRTGSDADLFHVVDHSYAQLVHELPASRSLVTCHDADTFRCLLHPREERRSAIFKLMARRTLSGLRRAARVCCDSEATRETLAETGLIRQERLSVVPLPVHPAFSAERDPDADRRARALLGDCAAASADILHVGSTIPRKRIDVLLKVVARLREGVSGVRLLRVGGRFTPAQEALIEQLGLTTHVRILPKLDRKVLAAVYRHAAVVLMTSEREGFGLPVVEALASGTPVVASDLAVLREVGSDAVTYCPVGDVDRWAGAVAGLLHERNLDQAAWTRRRERGVSRAQEFSYRTFARRLSAVYSELLEA
jgi:glycosyltransferase involved in cell wall biosynthesis